LYGIGIFETSEGSLVADTNSGMVKLTPHIDAAYDSLINFYTEDNIDELRAKLVELKKVDFIVHKPD
jgi:hypothetical protein